MLFCIFSFNRGQFLQNCVDSIERCVPSAKIAVFDDNSYDEETQRILTSIGERHAVVQPGKVSAHKLGGLYGNMQSALEYAADEDLVCFIQDDMQVVRAVSEKDIESIARVFDVDETLAFLQPCFLKGCNRKRDLRTLDYDPSRIAYFRKEISQSAGLYFSAVLITRPSRLLSKNWVFARSEPDNDKLARKHFGRIGHLAVPMAMWLPEVPTYRGKRKTLALKLAEKKRGCGFFPFLTMSDEDLSALRNRPMAVLPVAEDFLTCTNDRLPRPWAYYPLQGSRFLKKLNVIELFFRRLFA